MARSLSLAAYLAFARREPASAKRAWPARPDGELVWLHCSDVTRADTLARLGQRLVRARDGVRVLLTTSAQQSAPTALPDEILWQTAPSENPGDIAAFLDHWQPDCGLWQAPWLRPGLIGAAARRGVPLVLVDAEDPGLESRRWRWIPEPMRATLGFFRHILARSEAAAAQMRRLAPSVTTIKAGGPLLPDSPVLRCSESDLEELTESLAGRPVWLAAHIQTPELPQVLAAHRTVLRMAHRLLLVLVPAERDDAALFRARCREDGFRVACWDDGDFPDANTQVLLSEDTEELGLWYRAAPLCFMGSSLVPGHGGRNPFQPAALGSAILYGPGVRGFLDDYARLARAGAARVVKDADDLGKAVGELTAPDALATMAHAGWEVVSEGAELSDWIIALTQELLDERQEA